jgi:hypothetical protein
MENNQRHHLPAAHKAAFEHEEDYVRRGEESIRRQRELERELRQRMCTEAWSLHDDQRQQLERQKRQELEGTTVYG